ncbi:ABC transporter permease [Dactylosporangium sp. NPDC049525]|uniref:ABC transporter permease n=1 Tax=Dactylosporangium sp. NPDC049525 TaxID=3154730 RepID=UPI0034230933
MTHAIRAEWTKLRTLPSNVWSMAAIAGLLVAGAAAVIMITDVPGCDGDRDGCPTHDTTVLLLSGTHFAQIAAVALAAALICGEFHPRLIRTTLAMNPRRATVFTAKAVVVGATVLAAGALGVAAALLAGPPLLSGRGLTAGLGYPRPDLAAGALHRAAAGTVVYLILVALLTLGVSAAIRHAGASIGAMFTLLYGPYLVTLLVPMPAATLHRVQNLSPMTAGLAVQATVAGSGPAPLDPWTGIAVLATYAAAALLLGGLLFKTRDA